MHESSRFSNDAPRRVAVVTNRRSGTHDADATRAALEDVFRSRSIDCSFHEPGFDATGFAQPLRAALAASPDVLVACGGDGTVNLVANAIVKQRSQGLPAPALGIVPRGTFNYVARRYGISEDPGAAAQLIADGTTRSIGGGEVNGHLFLNNFSFGLYTSLIHARERDKRRFGRHRIVAAISGFTTLMRARARLAVALQLPDRSLALRASMVFAGVNPLQLGELGEDFAKRVDAGALGLVVVRSLDGWRLLKLAWGAVTASAAESDELEAHVVPHAGIVVRRRRLRCVVDGEVMPLASPLQLRWRRDLLDLRVSA